MPKLPPPWSTPLLLLAASCFYVTEEERVAVWDRDGDGIERPDDCDDSDGALGVLGTYYTDADDDGYGDPDAPVVACELPEGAVDNALDCDDADATSNPDAAERCDGADNDCDFQTDEGLTIIEWYRDADEDGVGGDEVLEACERPDGYEADSGDCDDDDPNVNPSATEVCNGIDDDCDDDVDEDDPSLVPPTWHEDADGDAWGRPGGGQPGCEGPTGWVANGDDCNDFDADVNPDADEVCNGVDDDCDDDVDGNAIDMRQFYQDYDGDGFGDSSSTFDACELPDGYVSNSSDCDDGDDTTWPGAPDCASTPDGVNNDCDVSKTPDDDPC